MPLLRFIAVALLAASSAVPFCTASAEPLDKAACANLQTERQKLLTPKMQSALERGPDWVKDNLNHEDIEKVRQFLLVEEKLMFRCRDGGGVARALQNALTNPDGVSLPDRKPTPPTAVAAAPVPVDPVGEPGVPLPDRNPNVARTTTANVTSSQTVADSDKTAPSATKATR
ncbi:MAG TPA: hypothetical protein VFR71_05085 [Methyloceanibacter sp.]|nr:hypothetical protein [Methyloceanibacter sp.]